MYVALSAGLATSLRCGQPHPHCDIDEDADRRGRVERRAPADEGRQRRDRERCDDRGKGTLSTEFTLHAIRNPDTARTLADHDRVLRKEIVRLLGRLFDRLGRRPTVDLDSLARFTTALHEGSLAQSLVEPDQLASEELGIIYLPLLIDVVSEPTHSKARRPSVSEFPVPLGLVHPDFKTVGGRARLRSAHAAPASGPDYKSLPHRSEAKTSSRLPSDHVVPVLCAPSAWCVRSRGSC